MSDLKCPHPDCRRDLHYFSGLEGYPAGYYCDECLDYLYDEDGEAVVRME